MAECARNVALSGTWWTFFGEVFGEVFGEGTGEVRAELCTKRPAERDIPHMFRGRVGVGWGG